MRPETDYRKYPLFCMKRSRGKYSQRYKDVIHDIERRLNSSIYYPVPIPQRLRMQWQAYMHDILLIKAIKII
jgi:hypothetical protein